MRKMAALCQAAASFLRPAAASATSRPGRVTRHLAGLASPHRPSMRSFDQVSVGFPPVPPPGAVLGGRGASAVPSAYANDGYGGAPMNQGSSPAPPVVEWDARNTNSVTVIGNTGMDPEMTVFDTGACVARVSLAVRGKKPALGGDEMSAEDGATTWLDVEAWNDEARQLCDHVTKGRQIQVTGRLKENTWTDKATGQKRSRIKVSAYSFAFIQPYTGGMNGGMNTGGMNGAMGGYQPDPYANQAVAAPQSQGQPRANSMQMQQQPMGGGGSDMQGEKDDLWREVLDNPDAWWDNRERKNAPGGNPRYPDFKHKDSQTPLWIESRDTPQWAIDALLGGPAMATAGGMAPQGGEDGFEPYYAGGGNQPGGGGGYGDLGTVDYSQPYAPAGAESNIAYEPAKPFEEDEPPF